MVGRGGLEPPTSRLSGVRSNHLSYRPIYGRWPAVALKRYEDGLALMFAPDRIRGLLSVPRFGRARTSRNILRKEVIQPQVPLRLPCYDFTPVAELTVVRCPLERLAHRLRVDPTPMV